MVCVIRLHEATPGRGSRRRDESDWAYEDDGDGLVIALPLGLVIALPLGLVIALPLGLVIALPLGLVIALPLGLVIALPLGLETPVLGLDRPPLGLDEPPPHAASRPASAVTKISMSLRIKHLWEFDSVSGEPREGPEADTWVSGPRL